MVITEIQTVPVQKMRHGTLGYLVLVRTDAGITGLGEVAADCHPHTVARAIREMQLVGRDPGHIEAFWQTFYQQTFWRGGPIWTSALSGVEQALWDIKGKQLGVPVYELVGGPLRDRIQLYTHSAFGDESPDVFAARALEAVKLGFAAVKFDPFGLAVQRLDPGQMQHGRGALAGHGRASFSRGYLPPSTDTSPCRQRRDGEWKWMKMPWPTTCQRIEPVARVLAGPSIDP